MNEGLNKMIEVAEGLGWAVAVDEKDYTFQKYSPAGQDFSVTVTADNVEEAIEQIKERCEGFDCSEETYLWLDDTGHGKNGAPYDMKDLYEDMEASLEMLQALHDELEKSNE